MATYVVFDKKTGEVVETHIVSDQLRMTRDSLLASLSAAREAERLDVAIVDDTQLEASKSYRIELQTGRLQPTDKPKTGGIGSGYSRAVEEAQMPRGVQVRHIKTPV